jgi:hypothetical protein
MHSLSEAAFNSLQFRFPNPSIENIALIFGDLLPKNWPTTEGRFRSPEVSEMTGADTKSSFLEKVLRMNLLDIKGRIEKNDFFHDKITYKGGKPWGQII